MLIDDKSKVTLSSIDQPLWFMCSILDKHPQNRFTSYCMLDHRFIKEPSERFDSNVLLELKYAYILVHNALCVRSTP